MPYNSGTYLPGERASKLGHLNVIESPWVRSLIEDFEFAEPFKSDPSKTMWDSLDNNEIKPLKNIWAVDGSLAKVSTEDFPPKEASFVKTALLTIDKNEIDKIDKEHPHPLLIQDVMTKSAIFHATVFPLKNIRTSKGSNYDTIRHIVKDSMKIDEDGLFYETLKWLTYKKWSDSKEKSLSFDCPHCGGEIKGLPYDYDEGICGNGKCGKVVYLTDMIGFHLDMTEDSAPDSVPSAYMLIMETLMLFTVIRILWEHEDDSILSDTLFIKDGPLTLRSQYSKLVPNIREFLQFAKDSGRPIHIIGQEKTGRFTEHLSTIARFASPRNYGDALNFFVLTHRYVREEVFRSPDLSNPYGSRTNYGEKVYLKFDPHTHMVINVPTGDYCEDKDFPYKKDLIGFDRIVATLPSLISNKHEGALFPIELANGIASLSSYPSAKILQRFTEANRKNK